MKNFAFFLLFALTFFVLKSVSYSGQGFPFGDNDSLLFDSDEGGSELLDVSDEDCVVEVLDASDATGDIYKTSIKKVCGVPDTVIETKRNVILKEYDRLVPNSLVKTGPNGDADLVFSPGRTGMIIMSFKLGPNSTFVVPGVDDMCKAVLNKRRPTTIKENFKIGKIMIDMKKDVGKLGEDFGNLINATELMVVHTTNTILDHIFTKFSIEVNATATDTTEIIKVYDGSVTVSPSKKSSSNNKSSSDEAKKLMDDYRNGKITNEEMQKKLKELTQNMETQAQDLLPITVESGNKCTASNGKLTVEPIESNDDRWWESIGK